MTTSRFFLLIGYVVACVAFQVGHVLARDDVDRTPDAAVSDQVSTTLEISAQTAQAQPQGTQDQRRRASGFGRRSAQEDRLADRLNANTVAIVSGNLGGAYLRIASDLAFTLNSGDELRILPIVSQGAAQNVYDVLFLRGVDLGLVRQDGLEQLRREGVVRNPEQQLTYVARLFNDEMHIVTTRDVADLRQLAGRRVSMDVVGSGANFMGRLVFERLGIPVEVVNVDQPQAFEMLRRGELAAAVSVAAKPVRVVADFQAEGRFHILDVPYDPRFADLYVPATLSNSDYPALVTADRPVSTLAVATILAAYNWPENTDRYRRVARFTEAFFTKFSELQRPPRHPKWQEVNLNAEVPGWTRFRAAAADGRARGPFAPWRRPARGATSTASSPSGAVRPLRIARGLFEEFMRWRERQPAR